MTRVSIFTHASQAFGQGHLARSETLATELRSLGISVKVTNTPTFSISETQQILEESPFSIVDFPFELQPFLARTIRQRPLVALDWIEPFNAPNYNVVAFRSPARRYFFEKELITGLEYLMIPQSQSHEAGDINVDKNELPVVLGSHPHPRVVCSAILLSQRLGMTPRLFGTVDPASLAGLQKYAVFEGYQNQVLSRLRGVTVAVTSGGVALTESLAAGNPTIVIPQNLDEVLFARELAKSQPALVMQNSCDWERISKWLQSVRMLSASPLGQAGAANVASVVAQRVM